MVNKAIDANKKPCCTELHPVSFKKGMVCVVDKAPKAYTIPNR
jgi:hypothetical protein